MVNPTPSWQYPPAPQYGAWPSDRPPLPESMRWAVGLMWAGAGLSVLYSIVTGVRTNSLFTAGTTNTAMYHGAYVGGMILEALLQVGLWLWMIWKVQAGRPWARVLSTVFFGFTCLQFIVVVAAGVGIAKVSMGVYFIVALAALIMLYQRESNAFFGAAKLSSYPQAGYGPPGYGPPGYGPPGYGPPGYGPPGYGPPGYGPPGYGPPGYGPPDHGQPFRQSDEPWQPG
jgi:hypothetical protein